ncbi:MAG: hypothetical protein HRT35_36340, partial [Algicola sp.]|nr:hypothetical protein [Algicola sp.]
MKKFSILGCVALCSSLLSGITQAETWIPIGGSSNLFFIPLINFQAQKLTPADYRLSWHNQSNATSYKVERLTADTQASSTSTEISTHWALISDQVGTSLDVTHNFTTLSLGVNQTYRLSTCDNAAPCTVIETISFEIDADNLTSTIPQNVSVQTQTASSLTASARFATANAQSNPYAWGKGYHFETGHNAPANANYTSNKSTLQSHTLQSNTPVNNASETQGPLTDVEITWDAVAGANHYMLAKSIDRGESPAFEILYDSDNSRYFHADSQTFQFGGLSNGTHIFVVYACNDNGFCGGASVAATRTIVSIPPTAQQVGSLNAPENVDDYQSYDISWTAPSDTVDLTGYRMKGELSGNLRDFTLNERSITRNVADANGKHPLAPGRRYCYNVKPLYANDKKGYYTGSQCVTIGLHSVLAEPEYLTIINHSFNPDDGYQRGYLLNWSKVD